MFQKQLRYFLTLLLFIYVFAPVHAQSDTAAKKSLSFDIGITRGHNINLWPFFKRYKNAEKKELQVLFPFYAQKRNYLKHTKHFRSLPFYISDSSSRGTDRRFLSLYYPSLLHTHRHSDSSGVCGSFKFFELAPHISLLGLSRSPGGLQVENNFFFFVLFKKDVLQARTSLVVFPAFWYFASRRDTTSLLFPFYLSRKSATGSYLNVAFLYNQKNTLFEKRKVLFPLWWHNVAYNGPDTVKKDVLFPLFWRKTSEKEKYTILFPFTFSVKNEAYRSFTFFPLFSYGQSSDARKKHLFITPLFWHTSRNRIVDTVKKNILFPVYWSVRSSTRHNTVLFPLIYSINNAKLRSFTFFPLFSRGHYKDSSGSYFSVTPLFWHTQNKRMVTNTLFPLYYNITYANNTDTVRKEYIFPLYWASRSSKENRQVLFPFYWHVQTRESESRVLFPFVFNVENKYYRSMTVVPLFSFGRSADSSKFHRVVTPLYWYFKSPVRSTEVAFPLLWQSERIRYGDTIRRKSNLFLYWRTVSKEKNNRVLFPFVYSFKDRQKTSFTLLPLFSYGHWRDSSRSHIGITPFYWHIKSRSEVENIVWPLYWSSNRYTYNDTIRTRTLLPIVWIKRSHDESRTIVFPFIFAHADLYSRRFTFFPLFSFGHTHNHERSHVMITPLFWHAKRSNSTRNVLFPVYWNRTIYRQQDTVKKHVVFPLYWSVKKRDKHNTVLFPLVYSFKNRSERSFTFFPLFSFGRQADSSRHLAVTPLFWQFTSAQKSSTVLFPLYFAKRRYTGGDTIQKRVVFPLYWSVHNNQKRNDIFLPLVFRLHNQSYHSFTFFPLFSYGHAVNANKRHLLITPLFGRLSANGGSQTYLFPLFNYRQSPEGKHFSALLFLFRHTSAAGYSRTSVLWPICEHVKAGGNKKFRIAPFFWYSKSDTSRLLSLQPFFYSYKSKEKNDFILSAFLYRRETVFGHSVSNSFLLRFYYTKKYFNGDFEHRFLHVVASNVKVDNRREKSILPFFHTVKEANGGYSVSYLLGLYNRFKEFKPEINDYYEEERVLWFIRLRSNYRQLKSEGKDSFVRRKSRRMHKAN